MAYVTISPVPAPSDVVGGWTNHIWLRLQSYVVEGVTRFIYRSLNGGLN